MMPSGVRHNQLVSWLSLFTSTGTLVCCALPALFVALGMGAALSGLISAVPQLIWLSKHKLWVFASAGLLLAIAGGLQWWARRRPCSADPALAAACSRNRKMAWWVWAAALGIYLTGALFGFILPLL